jgi:cytochrome P450
MPWLEKLWTKNTIINKMLPAKTAPVITFALARAAERVGEGNSESLNSRDFMSRFLEVQRKDPSIPAGFLTAWTTSNILAGSDTTAIALRSIIYFLLKNPKSMTRLTTELFQARKESRLSDIVTWKEAQSLEYLDACVKEAGRLHPAVGLVLERVLPSGGMVICGKRFKGGTVIGMNAWVVHRDKDVFGLDANEWNPDRWLCEKSQRQLMERSLLTVSNILSLDAAWSLTKCVVWTRPSFVHWKEHLLPGDIQADTDNVRTI